MPDWAAALQPYQGVGLALALGLLIGIERGWSHRREAAGTRVAGIRTFGLLGLLGGVAGAAGAAGSPLVGVVLLATGAAALLIGYAKHAADGQVSATTTVVGVLTLGLGVLAATGQMVMASAAAAVTMLVLAERERLHAWLERLSEAEFRAIVRFGLIALAVLPLLPDQAFGPYEAWNPRKIWMLVVMVSALSVVGYVAGKRFGASKGTLATAAAGALVSSTAVTAAMATRLRGGGEDAADLAAGIALASAIMFCRVMVVVGLLAPFALPALAVVAVPAALASAAYVAWILRRRAREPAEADRPEVRNPFDLGPALLLAALVMAISLAGRWAMATFGDAGLAAVIGLSGAVDVDAAVITLSGLQAQSLAPLTVGFALAAAILANTLVKAGLAFAVARGKAGWKAAVPLLVSVAAGLAGVAVLPLLFGS